MESSLVIESFYCEGKYFEKVEYSIDHTPPMNGEGFYEEDIERWWEYRRDGQFISYTEYAAARAKAAL